jgi:hypothetical protein
MSSEPNALELALRSKSDDELQRIAEGTPGAILQPMEARLARKVLADREAARRGKRDEEQEAEANSIASEANRRALEANRAAEAAYATATQAHRWARWAVVLALVALAVAAQDQILAFIGSS